MARLGSVRFGLIASVCVALVGLVKAAPQATTATVTSGQSIQSAIDAAKPGATIIVKKGNYYEQLTIKKDGIALVGQKGTVLYPPKTPIPAAKQNECYETAGEGRIAGICIVGAKLKLGPKVDVFSGGEHRKVTCLGSRVKGVKVSGFEVNGFSGENIALYCAEDACIKDNKLVDGVRYGYLAAGSKNTDFRGNKVSSTGLVPDLGLRFIGACSDNVAGATVWANDIDGYAIAVCTQTNKANIQHNHITNACYGIFVDPGIDGAIVRHNTIGPSNPACAFAFFVGSGIAVSGTNADVEHNSIVGQTLGAASTPQNRAVGIAVFDSSATLLASGNQIIRNDLSGNEIDLADISTKHNTVFTKNTCDSSYPDGLCT